MSAKAERGSALLTVVVLLGILLVVVGALLTYASGVRNDAIRHSRTETRLSCAEAGLQLSRSYYANHEGGWNAYLADPASYNPIPAQWITDAGLTSADPWTVGANGNALNNHPELFADLDGDGQADVYIFIRDDPDEAPVNNAQRDNNLAALVGAVCISHTMAPRLANGKVDTNLLSAEGLLTVNGSTQGYNQGGGCGNGDGNLNNCS